MLRTTMVVAVCLFDGTFAVAWGRPCCAPASTQGWADPCRSAETRKAPLRAPGVKQNAAPTPAADRDPYADPAAPYKANRLSSPQAAEPILNVPGQTTVLTRQILDDMNATSLRDALRSTAGVTVGR
jgi:outer membrane receptor protein involved in Fe transport